MSLHLSVQCQVFILLHLTWTMLVMLYAFLVVAFMYTMMSTINKCTCIVHNDDTINKCTCIVHNDVTINKCTCIVHNDEHHQ